MQRADVLFLLQTTLFKAYTAASSGELRVALYLLQLCCGIIAAAHEYDARHKQLSAAYFIRPDLLLPGDAPFRAMREARNEKAYINLLRITPAVMDDIMSYVDHDWIAWMDGFTDHRRTQRRAGAPSMLDAYAVIALTITYFATTAQAKTLELIFGVGHTVVGRSIAAGIDKLSDALKRMPQAAIRFPNHSKQRLWARMVRDTYGPGPYPERCFFGFVDGLRMTIMEPGDADEQQLFYNGWTRTVNIVNVLAFAPTGEIWFAIINLPGTYNDYTAASDLFERLHTDARLPGYAILGDSAFSSNETDRVVATENFDPELPEVTRQQRDAWPKYQKMVRKAVEWGMRTVQATWPRLKMPLSNSIERRDSVITCCLRLHNVIANSLDHHNEIKTVFMDFYLRGDGHVVPRGTGAVGTGDD